MSHPHVDQDLICARVTVLKEWLDALYIEALDERGRLSSMSFEGTPTPLGDLEIKIGEWSVDAARIRDGRPMIGRDSLQASLQDSLFTLPTVKSYYPELSGSSSLRRYIECGEMLRLALQEYCGHGAFSR